MGPGQPVWLEAARRFGFASAGLRVAPYGHGHIHDTYLAAGARHGRPAQILLQRINPRVFPDPTRMMENMQRVIRHVTSGPSMAASAHPLCPQLISTLRGEAIWVDGQAASWRAFRFVGGARSVDAGATPAQLYAAARGFGRFVAALADFPPPRLHEILPGFHDTPRRFRAFLQAVRDDSQNRAQAAADEIAFAEAREPWTHLLIDPAARGDIPERVVHNDTKINNVLLDERSDEACCVVDLDTTMPGLAPCDFGDLVRSAACPAAEDATEPTPLRVDETRFEALARGWTEPMGSILVPGERAGLVYAGRVITFEAGLRFLTDFLQGDVYFRTGHPAQNLDRCRRHFRLAESMECQEETLSNILQGAT